MFFSIREDKEIKNRIRFKYIQSDTYVGINEEEAKEANDVTILFMEGDRDSIYPDVIESPVFLVSDRFKQLIEPFEDSVIYKRVILSQIREERQAAYWLMIPRTLNCLSGASEYYPNGWAKRVEIDSEKAGPCRIFQVSLLPRPLFIINLDAAEAIMRREFDGIMLASVDQSESEWLIKEERSE